MTDSRNNIQKYIIAYQTTLNNLGATNVVTRVLTSNEDFYYSGLNPGLTGKYWSGSAFWCGEGYYPIQGVWENGDFVDIVVGNYNDDSSVGVRPLVIITI